MAPTRIQLCARLALTVDGRRVEDQLPGRQGRLLLAFLAANRLRTVTRNEAVAALWPDGHDGGLAPLLSKLRPIVELDELRPAADWVDVEAAASALHRAESALAQGDPQGAWAPAQVAMFVTGRIFLPGEGGPWIDTERQHLAGLHVRALETYAGATLGIGGTDVYEALRTKLRDDLGLSPSPPTLELYRRLLR